MNISPQDFSVQASFNPPDSSLKPSNPSQENNFIEVDGDFSQPGPKHASDKFNNHGGTNPQHLAIVTESPQLAEYEFTADQLFSSNREEYQKSQRLSSKARKFRIESPQSGLYVAESSDELRQSDKSLSVIDTGLKSPGLMSRDKQINITLGADSPCSLLTHNRLSEAVTILSNHDDINQSPLIFQDFRPKNRVREINKPNSQQINTYGMLSKMIDGPLKHQETFSCDSPTVFLSSEENKENPRGSLASNKNEGSGRPIVRRNIIGNPRVRNTIVEDRDLESNEEIILQGQPQMTEENESPEVNNAVPLANSEVVLVRSPASSNQVFVPAPQQIQRPVNQHRLHQNMLETLEAKITVKRGITTTVILLILSGIIMTSPFKTLYRRVFIALYLCFFWLLIESIVRLFSYSRETWRRKQDFFNGLDAINGILFIAFIDIKWSIGLPTIVFTCIPFLITAVTYARASEASRAITLSNLLQRSCYVFQVFFITMNVDSIIKCNWLVIGIFSMPYFGILGIFMLFNVVGFFVMLIFSVAHCQIGDRESSVFLYGNLWFSLYFSSKIIGFIAVLGLACIANGASNGHQILNTCTNIVFYECLALLLLSLFVYKHVLEFIKVYNSSQSQDIRNFEERKPLKFDLEVEKKESYFVMLSNTYFRPMDDKFFAKSKESLKAIQKRILSSSSFKRGLASKGNQAKKAKEAINLDVLKRYKEVLDNTFARVMKTTSEVALKMKPKKKEVGTISLPKMPDIECKTDQNIRASNNAIDKKHLSAEDLDRIRNLTIEKEITSHQSEMDDKLCYLCYTNAANAILLNCKHGGICYDCAVALVQKKNECMQCRTEINAIYKISTATNPFDIVKGIELTKLTKIDS